VEILPLKGSAGRITKGAGVAALIASAPGLMASLSALSRRMKDADVVYLNTAKALVYGVLANLAARRPLVFHLHDLPNREHFSRANLAILLAAANRADLVIANSRAVAGEFRKAGGRTRVEVVPNGFDPRAFDHIPAAEPHAGGRPVVSIFGRIARWKGQHLLIQAAQQFPDAEFRIIGEALFTDDDRAYAEELKSLARPMGDRVQFLGFRNDVPALMAAADIVVHCSTAPEPFGRVLVEAMLSRKPVIASDAGGPREIVEDGVTGFLTPPGDVNTLTASLQTLLSDPALRLRMGEAGRRRAEEFFSLSAVQARTNALLDELSRRP
jgi:glycosyltransferase involved in cell wall biosynthesis